MAGSSPAPVSVGDFAGIVMEPDAHDGLAYFHFSFCSIIQLVGQTLVHCIMFYILVICIVRGLNCMVINKEIMTHSKFVLWSKLPLYTKERNFLVIKQCFSVTDTRSQFLVIQMWFHL